MTDSSQTSSANTEIMAVLNVTPDSFSDGGSVEAPSEAERTARAVEKALTMVEQGATIVDVGGESTRPGAQRVPQAEESARVVPVVRELIRAGVTVSVDTMYAATAAACLEAGDVFINDVSGGLADDAMLRTVAEREGRFILSHWRGHSVVMNDLAVYEDAATEIKSELLQMRDRAVEAGIAADRIVLDPGLGFAKDRDDNWSVLQRLDEFLTLGHPLLIGVSRKRFMGALLEPDAHVHERDLPTAIVSALCAERGVWGVRVHNVEATKIAMDVVAAWQQGRQS
ncbi:MAG: dihydropteroate synthase [Gulosibacter sp.]|uniref:dihydropteroate synthase n=1 Tax=Gulosibacter sp. TaxID=2817531 RepID=UPI003F8F8B04